MNNYTIRNQQRH